MDMDKSEETSRISRRSSFKAPIRAEDKLEANVKKQDCARKVKFVYFPIFTVICDALQFTFMPWQMDLPWPGDWKDAMKEIANVIFFQFIDLDLGVSYEIIQYLLAAFTAFMLLIIYAPQQKLLLALGVNLHSALWMVTIAFQTVLFLPAARFALSAFYCTRYAQSFDWANPDKSHCWTGRHVGITIAASFTTIGLYVGVLHFIKTLFTTLEMTKRRFTKLSFALKGPQYTICLATVKLIFAFAVVFAKEILEKDPHAREIVTSCIMCVVLVIFLGFLSVSLPYKNQQTTCVVFSVLVTSTYSNIIGLTIALLDNPDSYVLPALWVFGIPQVAIISFFGARVFLHLDMKKKLAKASTTKALVVGNDIQGALPSIFLMFLDSLTMPNNIEALNLSGAFLDSARVSQISMAIASNMSSPIKRVDLSRNLIRGMTHGIDVIMAKSESVQDLVLDHNQFPPGIPLMATALAKNKTLLKLSLMNCGLGPHAGESVGEALMRNNTLTELNMAQNNLGEAGAKGLAKGLATNKSITALDVSWNGMRVEGLGSILDAFDRPVKLNMICNKVPQDTLAQLKARVAPPEEANPDEPTLEDLFKAFEVSSIFELVGKVLKLDPQVALGALCDDFYVRLVSDQRLLPFFANVSMGRMRNLQKECLMEALGGPKNYKGMDLKTAHAHFKIDDDVYDAVIAHLFASVLHFIPAPPKAVVVALVGLTEALRGAVCNTSIDQDMEVTSQEEAKHVTVMDKSKAAPYFSGSLWSTGLFKRRGKDDIHPALAAPKKYKGGFCCPFMSSEPEPAPNSDDKTYKDTEKQESPELTI